MRAEQIRIILVGFGEHVELGDLLLVGLPVGRFVRQPLGELAVDLGLRLGEVVIEVVIELLTELLIGMQRHLLGHVGVHSGQRSADLRALARHKAAVARRVLGELVLAAREHLVRSVAIEGTLERRHVRVVVDQHLAVARRIGRHVVLGPEQRARGPMRVAVELRRSTRGRQQALREALARHHLGTIVALELGRAVTELHPHRRLGDRRVRCDG